MLSEFETIERTLGAEKAGDLRKALHFLLRRQFVFAGDPRTGTVYNVLMDGRFRAVIDGFFDSCGYRVHRDTEAQWAGITALGEDVPLPKMKLDETNCTPCPRGPLQGGGHRRPVEERPGLVYTLNTLFDRYKEMVQS